MIASSRVHEQHENRKRKSNRASQPDEEQSDHNSHRHTDPSPLRAQSHGASTLQRAGGPLRHGRHPGGRGKELPGRHRGGGWRGGVYAGQVDWILACMEQCRARVGSARPRLAACCVHGSIAVVSSAQMLRFVSTDLPHLLRVTDGGALWSGHHAGRHQPREGQGERQQRLGEHIVLLSPSLSTVWLPALPTPPTRHQVLTHRLVVAGGVATATLEAVTAKFEELYQGTAATPGLYLKERLIVPKVHQGVCKLRDRTCDPCGGEENADPSCTFVFGRPLCRA